MAIGFYGILAYSTRNGTPLLQAELLEWLSWRWMYWFYIPVALLAMVLVGRYFRPDRPPQPVRLPIDWLAVTMFTAWVVAILFAFSWYRKWGGWTSNAFAATVILCVALPVFLAIWLGSGYSPDEHLKRLLRTRVVVLAMTVRGLMLTQMVGVLTIVGMYATELREYPRTTAGWLMAPTALTMAATTFLTVWFHRRRLRHVWLVVGMLGTAASVWWMSSLDNFTSKEHVALMLACWGAFLGLIPPAFLTDEVEGVSPADALYAGSLAIVGLVVPILTVPTATGTVIKAWSDRALDTYRLNLSRNRPAVPEAAERVADYYRQRGQSGPTLEQQTATVLGGFAQLESVAFGFRSGLRFLSLMMLTLGVTAALLLWQAARGLRARPGPGTSENSFISVQLGAAGAFAVRVPHPLLESVANIALLSKLQHGMGKFLASRVSYFLRAAHRGLAADAKTQLTREGISATLNQLNVGNGECVGPFAT